MVRSKGVRILRVNVVSTLYAFMNQSTDSTEGRLCLSVGWDNGPERGLKTVSFNL